MIEIVSEIVMDLQRPGAPAIVHAKQGEMYTRKVKIKLYSGGAAWTPPDSASCWISYSKPDGTGGTYGSYEQEGGVIAAVGVDGNALRVNLAPQVLTCAGLVCCEVHMASSQYATDDLSTFSFFIDVQASAESGITSEDYWNMARDAKVVLLNAQLSETANTVQTFDSALLIPTPNLDDKVLGTNGYVGTVTAANSSTVTVRATGEQWLGGGGGGDATKDYVDNLVRIGYINKTTEYFDSGYDNEEKFLRSLGYGRYYVSEDSTNVYTIETYYTEPYKHSTVRFYDSDGTESYKVYENDNLRLAWKRESGVYTVTSGDITIGKDAALSVPTIYADYGYKSDRAASKGYVDNKVRFGYIDMTTAAVYADRVELVADIAEYLMSLGNGRWSFNSDMDQHTEDMKIAVFVECVSTGEQKYWTVRIFEDDMSQYVRMYRQCGDDVSNRETLLDLYAEGGCPFSNLVLSSLTTDYLYVTLTPTEPTRAANKQYVDDAIAAAIAGVSSADYIDKTEEFTAKVASDGQTAALKWIRSLPTGKYRFNANIYSDAYEEVHLLDNLTIPFEIDGDSYSAKHCVEQTYDVNGNHWFYIFYGDETVYYLEEHRVGGEYVMNGTFRDYVNSRIPQKYGSEGLVLTSKEDGTSEWTELLPAYTADDAGKVLKVASDGTLYWGTDNDTKLEISGGQITV